MPTKKRVVAVATDAELRRASYRNRLKLAVCNTKFGQREWPTQIQNMLLHVYMQGLEIRDETGESFTIPLVDDVWHENERYIREFLASDQCEFPEKDRLIDLYFRVMMPDIAKHFLR